jgi:hypothetical protein
MASIQGFAELFNFGIVESKIAFVLIVTITIVVSFLGLINDWGLKKIIIRILLISVVIAPLVLIDNYRIFIIAVLAAALFECKHLLQK